MIFHHKFIELLVQKLHLLFGLIVVELAIPLHLKSKFIILKTMKSKNSEHRVSINSNLSKKANNFKNEEFDSIMKWASKISQHPHLYCPVNQIITNYHYYKIQFLEVSDIEVLLGKKKQYLQITCIIYNNCTQSFIGATYSSEIFDIEPKRQEKPASYCNKSIYFYTELDDIVLKVDVWRLQSDKNGKGIQNVSKRIYIGGFQINLGQSMQSGVLQKTLNSNEESRFECSINGQLIETQQSEQALKRKPSKILFSAINTHSLSHLHHFIAPNYIYDSHSFILGLKENKITEDGKIEMGERNRLNFQIKSVTIPINIGKKLTEISYQKLNSNFEINGRANINVKEIRLNLQFHNGWKSVCNESLILKQFNQQSTVIQTNRTAKPSKMQNKNSKFKEPIQMNKTYCYEKPKQLKAVFIGQGGILILWLQAKIQCKFDIIDADNNKKSKTQIIYLPVAFALKTIPQLQQQTTINIELFQGNVYSLSNLITYFTQLKTKKNKQQKNDQNNDKITCNINIFLKKTGGTIENIQTVQKDMNEIQQLKIEKQRLARLKRKIKQQKRKKMIQLNQQIPFLDTIQLKQQLYEEKIARLKNQKLQQQEILFFLKNKINQLQRQTLKNQLNFHENDDDDDEDDEIQTKGIKVKKLPNNFIDYRPEPETIQINDSIIINKFNASFCKMAMEPYKQVSPHLIQSCINSDTYIQFKVTLLQIFHEEINSVTLLIPNFEGISERLSLKSNQFENKSIQIKINHQSQKTQSILSQLLNGYFTIFLQIQNNKRLEANAIIGIIQLIEKCNSGDLLQHIQKSVLFEQENTLIGHINFTIAFTNNSNIVKSAPPQNRIKPLQNQGGMFSILNRISRFKQERGQDSKNRQLVSNIISNFNINKVNLSYKQLKVEEIKLNFENSTNSKQIYGLHIFDEDSTYLVNQELKIVKINDNTTNYQIQTTKHKEFQLQGGHSCQIAFIYMSQRMNINLNHFENLQDYSFSQSFYKIYNHCHKICINITEKQTNIIVCRYQISIVPEYQFNSHPIQRFLSKSETFCFPIITSNLKLITSKNDITKYQQKIDLTVPSLSNSDLYLSQFLLTKSQSLDYSVTFQNLVFYGWGCDRVYVDGRLWQKKDILIKIPLEVILQRQIKSPYQIESIIAMSRHISLKIRQTGDFKYISTLNINRKNAEILLRAQLRLEGVGKCTYGIQIADKNMKIFHRIGVCVNVEYPILAAHQIITIKVPSDRLEDPEPFSFVNRQQTGLQFQLKCFKPHLLRFGEKKCFLKVEQQWKIEMFFNWNRIVNELIEQEKDENSILIGIKSRLSIQYFLFKIKVK